MRLTEILNPQCIRVPLAAATKQEAIFALVDLLAAHATIGSAEELKQAVWQREMTRTTGMGYGIAIPHGKTRGCKSLAIAMARLAKPIDFGSIDGRPVDLVFLLASPMDQTAPHIQALASISRMLNDPDLRAAIKQTPDSAGLYQIIVDHESKPTVR